MPNVKSNRDHGGFNTTNPHRPTNSPTGRYIDHFGADIWLLPPNLCAQITTRRRMEPQDRQRPNRSIVSRSKHRYNEAHQINDTCDSDPTVIYTAEQYSIMEYIPGTPISSWNLHSLSDTRRHTVLEGLAVFLYRLWTCPVESETVRPTYRAWLLDEVDKAIRRSILNTAWDDPLTFLIRRAEVDPLLPEAEGLGLTIRHGDLNAWNVLVDRNGLAGIVDWDTVAYVPAPSAIQHPLFIPKVPGFRNDDVPSDMDFAEDRAYLEAAIRKLSPEAADLLATSSERQFCEMSLRNKRINKEYIRLRIGNADLDKKMMMGQLESFLVANGDMRGHASVVELRRNLGEI